MDRSQKAELVASLRQSFEDSSFVLVTHYSGLTVASMTDLRRQMLQANAGFKVTKNRLTRLALDGTKFEGLADTFVGPTAMAFSNEPVGAAKVAVEFAKKNDKLVILAAILDGQALDADGVKALASLPSLDELRAKIVGMINTPATRIAGVVQAPAGQLARVFNAYATKGEAA